MKVEGHKGGAEGDKAPAEGEGEGDEQKGVMEGLDKGVVDGHEDNFAIVFAAMGVSVCEQDHCRVLYGGMQHHHTEQPSNHRFCLHLQYVVKLLPFLNQLTIMLLHSLLPSPFTLSFPPPSAGQQGDCSLLQTGF